MTENIYPVRENFFDAWLDMMQWVKSKVVAHKMSFQVLETAIWIEDQCGQPIYFYDARDRAIEEGWKNE